jgi:orotate phosphoribosyltransferase
MNLTPRDPVVDHLGAAMARLLWEVGAVRVSVDPPFTLASGATSPIYVNCRQAISHPALVRLFATASATQLERLGVGVDAIAGGETAGIPFAAFLARELGKPMLYVRKQAKGYGLAARIEGDLVHGSRVLLVEDLITDGGSKLGFIEALRGAGAVVDTCLVLFDREQGGESQLADQGVRLLSLVDRTRALAIGREGGFVDETAFAVVEQFFAAAAAAG